MKKVFLTLFLLLTFLIPVVNIAAQKLNHFQCDNLDMIYFGDRYSYLLPHINKTYRNAITFHGNFWDYHNKMTYVVLNDFEDIGHAGALVMPYNQVQLGIECYSFAFSIIPSNERFQWLFNHELTHVTMADKPNKQDLVFRKIFHGKIRRNEEVPISALWSYFTTPRWYSPRWYQEGIACFMETWMSGGIGRAMGPYDEMYFRTLVNENEPLYSLVGLETEGTSNNFLVGANAYLYGTRFVDYLALQYGMDTLKKFYSRTDDSKAFYANQFKKVYRQPVNKVWKEWLLWEKEFQQKNIAEIKKYPLTPFLPVVKKPLGNVSNYTYNPSTGKIYAAVNFPGDISQIVEIDIYSGKLRKIAVLDSPLLYYSTDLAYDPVNEKLFITEHNNHYRNLVEIDIKKKKKKVINPLTRTGNLVFNKADESLWGIRNDNGYSTLVKIPKPYRVVVPIYTAPFGQTFFDPAISGKGDRLIASLSGIAGEQSLIMFDLKELEQGNTKYETILKLDDNTLNQFKFSTDDRYLIGTSYYTGVSNIWRINLDNSDFELLSNTETGLFMPLQITPDSLLVLKFHCDGMVFGKMPVKVLEDANSIEYLGNKIHDKYTEVEKWTLPPASQLQTDSTVAINTKYVLLKEMKFANAFPDIAGYKKTVVVGYRFNFRDPLGISNLNLFIATSPWSSYKLKQKLHFMVDWKWWDWHFTANYNPADFYDLFGPTIRSRAGYSLGLEYERRYTLKSPLEYNFKIGVYTYGDMEVLPGYQNVEFSIKNMQATMASFGISKVRKTLGAVEDEKGVKWEVGNNSYLVNGKFYSSFISNQDFGFLLPLIRNTHFWIRTGVGQSLGNRQSPLSCFYFGGFGNNYIDWQPSAQYRNALAFPGAQIDEIQAYNFAKVMGELNLRPIRFKKVGVSWLYPTYIKSSFFGTCLLTDFDKTDKQSHYFNAGAQLDIQIVMFSYLKTTWSFGYAHLWNADSREKDMLMFSLKLLGD